MHSGLGRLSDLAGASCDPTTETVFQSPDGKKQALLKNQICSPGLGASYNAYWVVVRGTADQDTQVFATWDSAPDVEWRNDQELVITVQVVSHIGMSLHQAGAVVIQYRIGERLSASNFRREMDEFEARVLAITRSQPRSPTQPLTGLRILIDDAWKDYHQFMQWAAKNAENGGA